jgi:hypothetical protein
MPPGASGAGEPPTGAKRAARSLALNNPSVSFGNGHTGEGGVYWGRCGISR